MPAGGGETVSRPPPGSRPATTLEGAVKWFEPDKGYGFISPTAAARTSSSMSRRCVAAVSKCWAPGSACAVDVVEGKKGLEADRGDADLRRSKAASGTSARPIAVRHRAALKATYHTSSFFLFRGRDR